MKVKKMERKWWLRRKTRRKCCAAANIDSASRPIRYASHLILGISFPIRQAPGADTHRRPQLSSRTGRMSRALETLVGPECSSKSAERSVLGKVDKKYRRKHGKDTHTVTYSTSIGFENNLRGILGWEGKKCEMVLKNTRLKLGI
jgi:hypothetical protein